MTDHDERLRLPRLCRYLGGRSRSSVYRDIAAGRLPAPIKIGGSSFWLKSEVDEKLTEARAERDKASRREAA